ncbi:MAG: 30S ribosomal protein S12 methylthiotransferase RimO [Chromatiales bacterium]|nr:30S ribosomal protein S12 methylthiotransferase RimO [Chromatiales bacterium]
MSERLPRVGFVSLGCPKALVDSERILTQLRTDGYEIAPDYASADLVVVNTCGFIDAAKAESLEAIGEALEENGRVIVTGCLGAHADEVLGAHPNVLAVTGPHATDAVVSAVRLNLPPPAPDAFTSLVPAQGIKLTPRHYAYLKISEGCNHRCSFCIIPQLRGDLVSRRIDDVMVEAERLVAAGVKELLVISQDTSAYGVDRRYERAFHAGRPLRTNLHDLCDALGGLGVWVRLHYVYPYPHVDDIIPLMAAGRVLPYLDIPFQHASARILKAMKRPAAAENTLARIAAWRRQVPELTLRSTFIVGFPGETDAEFEELLAFLREARIDRLGCFEYSPVEGAPANMLANPVPDEIKRERYDRLMQLQAQISAARLGERIGSEIEVLIDDCDAEAAIGRGPGDAPEIDGRVYLPGYEAAPGSVVRARIIDADAYDLFAEPIN